MSRQYDEAELRRIAVTALGRISVPLFQPGGGHCDASFDTPDYDYLVTRDGEPIGYGELGVRFIEALSAEITSA